MFVSKKLGRIIAAMCALVLSMGTMWAQNLNVSGRVTDQQGEPIVGAYVLIEGTKTGTTTDINGAYKLSAPTKGVLLFNCMGYKDLQVPVNGRAIIDVIMEDDALLLSDVVVVGYGTQKRVNLTGSVATVDVSKTLESKSTSNLAKALQGAVPGLTVINTSGKINGEPSIAIRGIGTLSNEGVSKPLYIVDGVPVDEISSLNMADVENISVLKDAASASIYGTRAAFGVVMITTKGTQKAEKITVNYSNNFGFSQATMLPNYPTVREQIDAMIEANNRANVANELFGMYIDDPKFQSAVDAWQSKHGGKRGYGEMILGDDYYLNDAGIGQFVADWDVVNIMFNRAAPSQNHTLSVQGTSGRTNFYVSAGYSKDQGMMNFNPDKVTRYNGTVNLTTNVTDWLQVGTRINYSNKTYSYPKLRQDTYQYMWRWGSFFGPYGTIDGIDTRTAIGYRKQAGEGYDKNLRTRIGAFAKITLTKGLTLNADYTHYDYNSRYKGVGLPAVVWNTWGGNITGEPSVQSATTWVETSRSFTDGYNTNIYANYEFTLGDNHNFNVMAGFNADEQNYEYLYFEKHDIMDENLPELALSDSYYADTHNRSSRGSAGFFARLNYNYADKYLIELNGRYDGSSKFPANARWAFFPSGSIGYRISQEEFFEPLKEVVNNLKLRASYGVVGNQEVGSNMFLETMAKANINWMGDGAIKFQEFGMPKMVSSSLTWESIASTNIGLDAGFFNGDLNFSFDWFQRDTKGMLAPGQTMPQVLGTTAAYENAGSLRTRGWELNIEWHHQFNNNVSVYAIGNLSDYKTVVTEWRNDTKLLNSNYSGKVYGNIYGFETDRYFEKSDFNADGTPAAGVASQVGLQQKSFKFGPGDIKFVDQNGDGKIDGGKGSADDYGDLIVIGNTTPRYQYSLRLGGNFYGFDADIYLQGIGKRDAWTQGAFVMPFMRGVDAIYANQTDYIRTADALAGNIDQNAAFPRMFGGGAGKGTVSVMENGCYNFYPQTKYLVNMAYLRIKNVTIGYTVPKNLTNKVNIEKIRLYVSANNLCDIINHTKGTGIDPEMNSYEGSAGNGVWGRIDPIYRTYSVGVQLTF